MIIRRLGPGEGALARASLMALLEPPEWRSEAGPSAEHLEKALADTDVYLLLAFAGDQAVGFVSAYRMPSLTEDGHMAYLYDVYVGSEHRRVGVGRQLVDAVLDACRKDGVGSVWVGTDGPNLAAQRLYESAGAVEQGRDFVEYDFDLGRPAAPKAGTEA